MTSLSVFIKSLKQTAILLPLLKSYLLKEHKLIESGKLESKAVVIKDSHMTIACFKERIVEYNHRQKLEGEYFHPSQLGVCMRAMFFSSMGLEGTAPTRDDLLRQTLIFDFGTYVHVLIQNLCERAGVLAAREVAIKDSKLRHLGHADGILKIEGRKYLLEIKTINSRGFAQLTAIKDAHKKQMHAYMKSLGLQWGIALYFNKDTSEVKEFVIQYSEDYYREEVATRIERYFKFLRRRVLPPKEGDNPNRMPCSYCQHVQTCFNPIALKEWMKQNNISDKFKTTKLK